MRNEGHAAVRSGRDGTRLHGLGFAHGALRLKAHPGLLALLSLALRT
jgi:hypothetical protein